ncbi:Alpha/Beta hydrolase protein [Suillus plorans]|uniref:Alpha/Beta hydrolase protein n=1 Tax=Suillus plorans TaxID=116603 RepID=A0A9P7DL05_9AGAM|nr:Alpha/Beta hydrolase protein [Suillus plorans]KAG1797439.1 Alpha/Beta hydrolase protein [Suillus plorans]
MGYASATVPSASQWGSPIASKRALLIHGLNSSSHTFHHVASMLAAKGGSSAFVFLQRLSTCDNIIGYLVVAPNLLGHALRMPGVDFRVQTLADDLLPYLQAAEYDIVIGHSMGGAVVLSLLKYLPRTRPTSVVLVDSSVELTADQMTVRRAKVYNDVRVKPNPTVEDYMASNLLWMREDAIWRSLGTQIARATNYDDHMDGNVPWSFSHLFADRPSAAALTVLIADPRSNGASKLETVAKFKDVRAVIVPNTSHWIQYEFPEVIVEEALRNVEG